jgi:hypothetical protein
MEETVIDSTRTKLIYYFISNCIKDLRSTLRYTRLIIMDKDEYHAKVARTAKEAVKLIEQGFEYVCEMEGVKIFRKRK